MFIGVELVYASIIVKFEGKLPELSHSFFVYGQFYRTLKR